MTRFIRHSPGLNSPAKPSQFGGPGNVWAGLRLGSEGKVSFSGLGRWEKSCRRTVMMVELFPWCGQPWKEKEPAGLLTSIFGTGCNFNCLQHSSGSCLERSVPSQQEERIALPTVTYLVQNFLEVAFWLETTTLDELFLPFLWCEDI